MLRPLSRGRLAAWPDVRLPIPIAGFRPQGRLSQLSAINRHNQRLFDDLVGAQQNRRGYGKTERRGGLAVLLIGLVTVARRNGDRRANGYCSAINYDSFFQERYCSRRANGRYNCAFKTLEQCHRAIEEFSDPRICIVNPDRVANPRASARPAAGPMSAFTRGPHDRGSALDRQRFRGDPKRPATSVSNANRN